MTRKTIKKAKDDFKRTVNQKWEILRRNPEFIKDFDTAYKKHSSRVPQTVYSKKALVEFEGKDLSMGRTLYEFLHSAEADAVAQKYGLGNLWDYNDSSYTPVFTGTRAVEIIPHNRAQILANKIDISPHLKDGRFLTVRIDLHKRRNQIEADVKLAVDRYLPHTNRQGRPKGRGPAHGDDLWRHVYDMHVNQGMKFTEIMHSLFPRTRDEKVNIDKYATSVYKTIHRAFEKAKSIIQE